MRCQPVFAGDWSRRIIALVWKQSTLPEKKAVFLVSDLYADLQEQREPIMVAGEEQKEPWELLAYYIRGNAETSRRCRCRNKNIRALVISMETLDAVQVDNLQKACGFLGLHRKNTVFFMDYEESFYYYVMTQKIETWNRSVGWYSFHDRHVTFRRMVMNAGNKPVPVMLETPVETDLSEDMDAERCRFLCLCARIH